MNIFIVADETSFYHPDFLHELLKKNNHNIVGAALVTKLPEKNSLERYLIKHFYSASKVLRFQAQDKKTYAKKGKVT